MLRLKNIIIPVTKIMGFYLLLLKFLNCYLILLWTSWPVRNKNYILLLALFNGYIFMWLPIAIFHWSWRPRHDVLTNEKKGIATQSPIFLQLNIILPKRLNTRSSQSRSSKNSPMKLYYLINMLFKYVQNASSTYYILLLN